MNKKIGIFFVCATFLLISTSLTVSSYPSDLKIDKRLEIEAPTMASENTWIEITVKNQGRPIGGAWVDSEWTWPEGAFTGKDGKVHMRTPYFVPVPTYYLIRAQKASYITEYHLILILP